MSNILKSSEVTVQNEFMLRLLRPAKSACNVDIPNMQVFVNHEIRFLNEEVFSAGTALKYSMYL